MCSVLQWWKHHESVNRGIPEGFLEEEASQLTPLRPLLTSLPSAQFWFRLALLWVQMSAL